MKEIRSLIRSFLKIDYHHPAPPQEILLLAERIIRPFQRVKKYINHEALKETTYESEFDNHSHWEILKQWMNSDLPSSKQQFLLEHPILINQISEDIISSIIQDVSTAITYEPLERMTTIVFFLRQRYLLQDIRTRLNNGLLKGSTNRTDALRIAIHKGFVNLEGGFGIYHPVWLDEVRRVDDIMTQEFLSDEMKTERCSRWNTALKRAQKEGVADEITFEIYRVLGIALLQAKADNTLRNSVLGHVYLHNALAYYQANDFPFRYANTALDFGRDLLVNGEGNQEVHVEQAISLFADALQVFTEEDFPIEWAITQRSLGEAYDVRVLGNLDENTEQAIVYYDIALRVLTESTFPVDWATIQWDKGSLFVTRTKGDRGKNIEQTIACYTAGLRVLTKDNALVEWGLAQLNLGLAYAERLQGDRAENIEQAIYYYTATSEIFTERFLSQYWSLFQVNLGNAYCERTRGDRAKNLEKAIDCYINALRIEKETEEPLKMAEILNNLGIAYRNRISGNRADNLEKAITYYSTALLVQTEQNVPVAWARTQHNLGIAYGERIEGDPQENEEQAITCFLTALRIRTEQAFPIEWADTQFNLAVTYHGCLRGDRKDNLEKAIQCYSAALRIRTEQAMPRAHRDTSSRLAEAFIENHLWEEAHAAYSSALRVEDDLYILAGDVKNQDIVLQEGLNASSNDAFVLAQMGAFSQAAVVLESGRTRGLAVMHTINLADPYRIGDLTRRGDFLAKRDAWRKALAAIQQPESRLNAQATQQLVLTQQLREAREVFNAAVKAIQDAQDPADFLKTEITEDTLFQAARRRSGGHAIVALVPTRWGGIALGTLTANTQYDTGDRFAILDLPSMTHERIAQLGFKDIYGAVVGGFGYAQQGNVLDLLLRDWAVPETVGTEEGAGVGQNESSQLKGTSFEEMATLLHEVCQTFEQKSTLDDACQQVLSIEELLPHIDLQWKDLPVKVVQLFKGNLQHEFLLREIEENLTQLSEIVMCPLAEWLLQENVTSVTIIPCGRLSAFPLLACKINPTQTFADIMSNGASMAPNARSLIVSASTNDHRAGVATLGNPGPTSQSLRYGEAEAMTLAYLGGEPKRYRLQRNATREWLLECLRNAQIVDVSCHGVADKDYLQSHLLLADGVFTLADALNNEDIDLRGLRLLILSACQTSIPTGQGAIEEVHSLAVGMLQAGIHAILGSFWSVEDKATYLLMVKFAQEWFPKWTIEPPAVALARAQRWLRLVTWEELQHWQIDETTKQILKIPPEDHQFVHSRENQNIPEQWVIEGEKEGHVYWSDYLQQFSPELRYTLHEGQIVIQGLAEAFAKNHPQSRPFAHPFFWAGFSLTGW